MNIAIKLPDYVPNWLKITMVTFIVFCVIGLPFWIFVIDEVQEMTNAIAMKHDVVTVPDSISTTNRSTVTRIIKDPSKVIKSIRSTSP